MIHILAALGLACVTVIIHALGTSVAIAHLARLFQYRKPTFGLWKSSLMIARIVGFLLLLHVIEAGLWAFFYLLFGDLPNFETAIYFSVTSYTTVGYGDVVLPQPWRILGPIEAGVGILMFGWSTAIIVAAVTRIHSGRLVFLPDQPNEGNGSRTLAKQ